MNIKIHQKQTFKQSNWSGGTTTELYIFPEDADYAKRNFNLRISSAKVELETSEFTHLPGVQRALMPLIGNLDVRHKGHHSVQLKPFEVDYFMGDWTTQSFGACVDFNVMTKGDTQAALSSLIIQDKEQEIRLKAKYSNLFIYAFGGGVQCRISNQEYCLEKGDLMQITNPGETPIFCRATQEIRIILVESTAVER